METLIFGLLSTYDQVLQEGGSGTVFIVLRKSRQPLDQTDFMYGENASKKRWRNTPEGRGRIPQVGPGGMAVGLAGPAWQLLILHFGPCLLVSSGVF
jgi:hypothetical protein